MFVGKAWLFPVDKPVTHVDASGFANRLFTPASAWDDFIEADDTAPLLWSHQLSHKVGNGHGFKLEPRNGRFDDIWLTCNAQADGPLVRGGVFGVSVSLLGSTWNDPRGYRRVTKARLGEISLTPRGSQQCVAATVSLRQVGPLKRTPTGVVTHHSISEAEGDAAYARYRSGRSNLALAAQRRTTSQHYVGWNIDPDEL
jgi:hypothetical protein